MQTVNTENIRTVAELITALQTMPLDAIICGSSPNGHDEYDCEVRPFWVKRYHDGTPQGLCFVGIDYKHPN